MKIRDRSGQIVRYVLTGGITTLISLGVYYVSVIFFFDPHSGIQLQIANVISWIAAVTFAYFANRKFVFRSNNSNIIKEAFFFYASRVTTLLMDMILMFVLVTALHMNDKMIKIIVQVVVMILNYLISKLLVFT